MVAAVRRLSPTIRSGSRTRAVRESSWIDPGPGVGLQLPRLDRERSTMRIEIGARVRTRDGHHAGEVHRVVRCGSHPASDRRAVRIAHAVHSIAPMTMTTHSSPLGHDLGVAGLQPVVAFTHAAVDLTGY